MNIPNWWETALLALASFRIWKLLADDTILNAPRERILGGRERLSEFLDCPYCSGFWIALAWWGAWEWQPRWTLISASPWAINAASGLISTHRE